MVSRPSELWRNGASSRGVIVGSGGMVAEMSSHVRRPNLSPWTKSLRQGTISVLVAAWKTAKHVERALLSVLTQSLPPRWDLEVLVGVDADEDTLVVVQKVAESDARVVVISMDENVGPYAVLNTLLLQSRGGLIAILDSDDVALPGRLADSISLLARNPQAAMVGSQSIRINEQGGKSTPSSGMVHSSWTCHRQLYLHLGGYKPFRCGADTDFVVRARNSGASSVMSTRPWVTCVIRKDSLCRAPETNFKSPMRKKVAQAVVAEQRRPLGNPTRVMLRSYPHSVIVDRRPPCT